MASSHRVWRLIADRLPAGTVLAAPDLRGRDDTGGLPGPYGMARHADDCAAALDALGYAEAVRGDSIDLHTGDASVGAWSRLRHEALFLRAEYGMLGGPPALYADRAPIVDRMPVRIIDGTNHYTILLGARGAAAVAEAL